MSGMVHFANNDMKQAAEDQFVGASEKRQPRRRFFRRGRKSRTAPPHEAGEASDLAEAPITASQVQSMSGAESLQRRKRLVRTRDPSKKRNFAARVLALLVGSYLRGLGNLGTSVGPAGLGGDSSIWLDGELQRVYCPKDANAVPSARDGLSGVSGSSTSTQPPSRREKLRAGSTASGGSRSFHGDDHRSRATREPSASMMTNIPQERSLSTEEGCRSGQSFSTDALNGYAKFELRPKPEGYTDLHAEDANHSQSIMDLAGMPLGARNQAAPIDQSSTVPESIDSLREPPLASTDARTDAHAAAIAEIPSPELHDADTDEAPAIASEHSIGERLNSPDGVVSSLCDDAPVVGAPTAEGRTSEANGERPVSDDSEASPEAALPLLPMLAQSFQRKEYYTVHRSSGRSIVEVCEGSVVNMAAGDAVDLLVICANPTKPASRGLAQASHRPSNQFSLSLLFGSNTPGADAEGSRDAGSTTGMAPTAPESSSPWPASGTKPTRVHPIPMESIVPAKMESSLPSILAELRSVGLHLPILAAESKPQRAYRRHYAAWVTSALRRPRPRGVEFRRILVMDGNHSLSYKRVIQNAFGFLTLLSTGRTAIRSVMFPLSLEYAAEGIDVLTYLLDAALRWCSAGLNLPLVRILLPPGFCTAPVYALLSSFRGCFDESYRYDPSHSYQETDPTTDTLAQAAPIEAPPTTVCAPSPRAGPDSSSETRDTALPPLRAAPKKRRFTRDFFIIYHRDDTKVAWELIHLLRARYGFKVFDMHSRALDIAATELAQQREWSESSSLQGAGPTSVGELISKSELASTNIGGSESARRNAKPAASEDGDVVPPSIALPSGLEPVPDRYSTAALVDALPVSNGSVAAPSAITEGDARPVNELIATLDRMVVAGPHSKAIFGSEDGAATSKIAPGGGVATADQTAAAAAEAEARSNPVSDGAVMASSEERKTSYIGDPVANSENPVAEPASAMNREPLVLESARTAGDEAEVRSAYFMDEWYSALLHSRRLVALVSDSFFRSPQCGTLFSLAVCQACEFGPETFCMIYWRSADLPALAQCIPDRCVLDCREQNREALPRAVGDLAALHRRLERVENLRHEQHEGGLARQLWQQNRDVNSSALSRNRGPPESRRASFNETNSSDASGVSSASQSNADPWRFCSRGVGFQSRTLDQGQNPSRFVAAAKGALGTEPGTAALQHSLSTVREAVTVDTVEIRATEMEYYGNAPLLFDSEWRAKWDIPYDELQLGSKLGSGAFGEVFMAEWRGLVVAVKQLTRDDDGFSLETVEDFQKEMVLLSRLRHPNIVPFCGAVTRPPHLCIVLGFVSGGSLYRLIHSRRSEDGPAFTLAEIAFLSLGIAQGMLYLHSQRPPVIHRDLKSPNVLIDGETGMPIVTDFGLSRSRVNTMLMTGAAGTPEWMAPEVMRHEAVDEKSDVWSYGVIVWELITGEKPWSNEHPIQVIYRVAQRGDRLYPPRETDEGLKSLLDGCFRRRSQQRPDFEDIVVFWEEFQRALGRRERNENTPTPRLQAVMDRRRSKLRRQRGGSSKPPSGTELDKKFPADDDDAAKREELRAALVEEI